MYYFLRQQEEITSAHLEPWHDLWEVEKGLSRLRSLEWDQWQAQMSAIVGLTEGIYLDGCDMDWAVERRDMLEIELTEALFKGCKQALEREDWIRLSEWSQRLLERDLANQAAAVCTASGLSASWAARKTPAAPSSSSRASSLRVA